MSPINPNKKTPQHIAFYGSLMKSYKMQAELVESHQLTPAGRCQIEGVLYDLGEYPGMVAGPATVFGELYKIADPKVLKALDKYEEYYPGKLAKSLFVRRTAQLKKPKIEAWVYFYNRAVTGKLKITGGNWNKHLERQGRIH